MRTDPRPHYGQRLPRVGRNGYVRVYAPDHPMAMADGYVLEHRMVAWDAGILIDPAHHVHHRNKVRTDNRPENLEAMSPAEHLRRHPEASGFVRNQHGVYPVKPRAQRGKVRRARSGSVRAAVNHSPSVGAVMPSTAPTTAGSAAGRSEQREPRPATAPTNHPEGRPPCPLNGPSCS